MKNLSRFWMVGNPSLGITSKQLVIRAQSHELAASGEGVERKI